MKMTKLSIVGLYLIGATAVLSAEEAKPVEAVKTEPAAKQTAPGQMKKKTGAKSAKTSAPGQMKKGTTTHASKQMWKCPHCNLTSDKAGKCSKCGAEMQKM